MRISFLHIMMLFMILSCKKDSVIQPIDLGYDYFPGIIGSWVIYDVDSIVYPELRSDTLYYSYQVKELIESEYIDNEGRSALRIERYHRKNANSEWSIPRIWTAYKSTERVERMEENTRYISMSFPVKQGDTWNGNALNSKGKWSFEYTQVDKNELINTTTLDSVLTVEQINEVNCIQRKIYIEKYAKNIGLIYRHTTDIEIKTEDCVKLNSVDGLEYKMTLHSYKN